MNQPVDLTNCDREPIHVRGLWPDLPSPAEAPLHPMERATGFAQAGNRFPLFRIMLQSDSAR